MPVFVGIDLAWTAHREDVPYESGICVLESKDNADIRCSRLEAVKVHITDIATWLGELTNESSPVVVAIDAPLIVTPTRNAEKNLNKEFSKYNAGAYTTSIKWIEGNNINAGPLLGKILEKSGFNLDPSAILQGTLDDPTAIEVYPHPIHVRLFSLKERIAYKKGNKAKKRQGLLRYQGLLHQYIKQHAYTILENPKVLDALTPDTLSEYLPGTSKKGPSLKHYEDMLDSLTCALAAWQIRTLHSAWKMHGDVKNGYIVAPRERPALS